MNYSVAFLALLVQVDKNTVALVLAYGEDGPKNCLMDSFKNCLMDSFKKLFNGQL